MDEVTVKLRTEEEPPDDLVAAKCDKSGYAAGGRYLVCDRVAAHDGDHFDRIDVRYWTVIEPEQVPA